MSVRNIIIRVHGIHQYYVMVVFTSISPSVLNIAVNLLPIVTSLSISARTYGVRRVGYNLYKDILCVQGQQQYGLTSITEVTYYIHCNVV